jgi:preprotein translocase subunit YajC
LILSEKPGCTNVHSACHQQSDDDASTNHQQETFIAKSERKKGCMETQRKQRQEMTMEKNLACTVCDSIGPAYTLCVDCVDTGMVYDGPVGGPKKGAKFRDDVPWWAIIRRRREKRLRRLAQGSSLSPGDRVIILKGGQKMCLQTGRVTARQMDRYVEIEYWMVDTGRLATVRKDPASVIAISPGLEVTRDERGMLAILP